MQNLQISPRLEEHERLVVFLDNMAVLLGCTQTLNSQLPDATRPDVIRLSVKNGFLFVGDAKNTEMPSSSFTQERLFNYLKWLSSFLDGRDERKAIFAISHNHNYSSYAWIKTVKQLFLAAQVDFVKYGTNEFDPHTHIVWFQAVARRMNS